MKKVLNRRTKRGIFVAGALFVPVVHFIIFWFAVNFNSILLAFKRFDPAARAEYYTLDNFKAIPAMFGKFGELRVALGNTLLTWAFLVVFLLPWGFLLTYFLYKKVRLSGVWRTMLFIPSLLPAVALTSVFIYITLPKAPVGQFLGSLFPNGAPALLAEARYAKWTVLLYIFLTNFGGQFILFSGAMARIPKELLESANIDGAGLGAELFKIVLPLCWSTFSMLILLNLAGIFTASGPVLLLTEGRANTATISFWFFNTTRFNNHYMPAATGVMFTLALFPIVLLARWGLGKIYADVEF